MTQADEPQLACPYPCTTECVRVTTDRFGNVVRQAGVESDWKLWEVWVEGHQWKDGSRRPACYRGAAFGKDLKDAAAHIYGGWVIKILMDGTVVSEFDEGARIFDNEADAKILYGC